MTRRSPGIVMFVPLLVAAFLVLDSNAYIQQKPALPESATYFVAFLRKGPQWSPEVTPESQRIQAEHMANIRAMSQSGALVAAGPFIDAGDLRGIYIFKVDSQDQAQSLSDSDPAIKTGRLRVQVRKWSGTKGIGEQYAAEKKKNPQMPDTMASYQLVLGSKGPKFEDRSKMQWSTLAAEHLGHIATTMASGKLRVAGPFADAGEPGGIFIYDAGSIEQARALIESDPLVKAGLLSVQVYTWMTAKGVLP